MKNIYIIPWTTCESEVIIWLSRNMWRLTSAASDLSKLVACWWCLFRCLCRWWIRLLCRSQCLTDLDVGLITSRRYLWSGNHRICHWEHCSRSWVIMPNILHNELNTTVSFSDRYMKVNRVRFWLFSWQAHHAGLYSEASDMRRQETRTSL